MDKVTRLYELLDLSAEQHPLATALLFKERKINYCELQRSAESIREHLERNHVGRGDRVAIYSPKSIAFVVAQFAILKAGAAYVPLDFFAPSSRNKTIIDDCEPKAIIVKAGHTSQFTHSYHIDTDLDDGMVLMTKVSATRVSNPDLAYILYTSGSTGTPKGVMFTNSAALEFIRWCSATFLPTAADRFSSHAPFHFDLSIFDLFVSVSHAASLVLIDEDTAKHPLLLARLISEEKISIWYSTPTILNMLTAFGKMNQYSYDSLRLVLFAGEIFPPKQLMNLKQHWYKPEFYNLYGPTETNVCTFYKIPEVFNLAQKSFPIGKCCSHYSHMIQASGELCISGTGTMLGYWGPERLNKNAFFYDEEKYRWYRTGDLAELDMNGDLIFKGRIDRMVKRNGYRIELAEIEAALHAHPSVIENAVIAKAAEDGSIFITAFVNMDPAAEGSLIGMKQYCMQHLPVYMIPNNFIFLERLPQTASNKIDYQQLKALL